MKDNRTKHFRKRVDTLNRTIHKFRQFIAKTVLRNVEFKQRTLSSLQKHRNYWTSLQGYFSRTVKENPSIKLRGDNPYLIVSVVDPHWWFQRGFGPGSCFLPQWGFESGSRETNQCGSMRIRILVRQCEEKKNHLCCNFQQRRSRTLRRTREFLQVLNKK